MKYHLALALSLGSTSAAWADWKTNTFCDYNAPLVKEQPEGEIRTIDQEAGYDYMAC